METFLNQVSLRINFTYSIVEIKTIYDEVEKNETAFLEKFLTPLEREIVKKFVVIKRKMEWLGGRLAAKQAFGKYQESYGHHNQLDGISVLNDSSRAPYIAGYDELILSISHAGNYAVAVLAKFPIGVDIEKITARPQLFSHYFLCHEEQDIIEKMVDRPEKKADLLTYFWTRKEAVSKVVKKGSSLNFKTINTCGAIAMINNDVMIYSQMNDAGIQLFSGRHGQYYLSLAMNT